MTRENTGAARFLEHLNRARELTRERIADGGLDPALQMLSEWQTQRLAATYADFSAVPRYRPAMEFFLTDLYGARDFSQRDHDIERVFPIMRRVLSEATLLSMSLAVELHALTQALDRRLVEVLRNELDIGADGAGLDNAAYAEAYRICDNYAQRAHQIDLVVRAGELLEQVVRRPTIYAAVRVARKPARAAGFGELQDFIERGLAAFRRMRGADRFLHAVRTRETAILDEIFAGGRPGSWEADAFPDTGPDR